MYLNRHFTLNFPTYLDKPVEEPSSKELLD